MPVTALPSSMTEQSNFENVPFSMPGRACQDDSFVSSVDNSKPQVDPFVLLVRQGVVVWASGEFKVLAQLELFRCWTLSLPLPSKMQTPLLTGMRSSKTVRQGTGETTPSCTRFGAYRRCTEHTGYTVVKTKNPFRCEHHCY